MAGIYSQVYIQVILSVRKREHLIPEENQGELFDYIADVIVKKGQKPIIVNGFSNHVHAFMSISPDVTVAELVREIKSKSAGFINKKQWLKPKFAWHPGFGAFSYSHSQVESVFNFLRNQQEYHRKISFRQEFHEYLTKFMIAFSEEELFDWVGEE